MGAYLLRRFFQMVLVVFLATLAIYVLLNVAPGGPLSGLQNATADRKQGISDLDIQRLEAYLGIDKPLLLRYVTWLLGDDWLGADWMHVSWNGYTADGKTYQRFWADPGVAHLKPGYPIRVRGEADGHVIEATYVEAKPQGKPPAGALSLVVYQIEGSTIVADRGPERFTVHTSPETQFVIPGAPARPEEGTWLHVGWLSNPYHGILGPYAGFRGSQRGVVRLDWGTSWKLANGQPVLELVKSRLGNTLLLMTAATVLSLVVAIPIGIISAVKQYSLLDYAVTTLSFFGSAMPSFWFGLMLILLFSYKFREWGLPFMPAGGVALVRQAAPGNVLAFLQAAPDSFLDRSVHLLMPTLVLSLAYMAGWSRFTRSSMLEVLRQDYVRTARAKGLRERLVLVKHSLRNALIPLITIVVFQIPTIFGGTIITETIFKYQGMGQLYFSALNTMDWPVAMALLMITSILVVVATLVGDVLYTVVDPRIRLE